MCEHSKHFTLHFHENGEKLTYIKNKNTFHGNITGKTWKRRINGKSKTKNPWHDATPDDIRHSFRLPNNLSEGPPDSSRTTPHLNYILYRIIPANTATANRIWNDFEPLVDFSSRFTDNIILRLLFYISLSPDSGT